MWDAQAVGQGLEAAMLICFGVSWPVDIYKAWTTRRTEGKSLAFMCLVFAGYLAGVAGKLTRALPAGLWPEQVTALYAINALLVAVDIALYLRFRPRLHGRSS